MNRHVLLASLTLLGLGLLGSRAHETERLWGTTALTLKPARAGSPSLSTLLADHQYTVSLPRFYRAGGDPQPAYAHRMSHRVQRADLVRGVPLHRTQSRLCRPGPRCGLVCHVGERGGWRLPRQSGTVPRPGPEPFGLLPVCRYPGRIEVRQPTRCPARVATAIRGAERWRCPHLRSHYRLRGHVNPGRKGVDRLAADSLADHWRQTGLVFWPPAHAHALARR